MSTVGGNLGTALFATAIGRWFLNGVDLLVLLWLATAIILLWASW